jgi:hypothetical protein
VKTTTRLILFGLAALAQLAVPASMIARREYTLRHGQVFRLRTAPVDPYDAFRGRYVALTFDQRAVALPPDHGFSRRQRVHALLAEDENGFAVFSGIQRERPASGPYLSTRIAYITSHTNAFLQIPFDRLYMMDTEAPEAERAYLHHNRSTNRTAFVQIRIHRGFGVIEDLYLDGMPIRDYLAQPPTAAPPSASSKVKNQGLTPGSALDS